MNDPIVGQQLGNYRVHRVLGRGGMATVYYSWDENLQRPVAIKLLDARYRHNPAYAERFVEEARAVATWRHENVLQVYSAGHEGDLYFFAMEYIDGPDLGELMRQYVEDGELMPHEDVLRIGRAVASALDYAHQKQVIHRDVKPSNVMVAKDGRVVLADFGLALNVQRGSLGETFGTPHYIAPEQARNSAMAVPQSDLYALGIILYELLTGSVPFDDPSPTSLALQHINSPPPPPRELNPSLNEATAAVLLEALAKDPNERYQTGAELLDALSAALRAPKESTASTALPPLPSAVTGPALSQQSVAERVSLYLPPPPAASGTPQPITGRPSPAPTPAPAATTTSSTPAPQKTIIPLSWVAGGVLGIAVLVAIFAWLNRGGDETAATAVASLTPSPPAVTVSDVEIPAPAPTDLPATGTASPTAAAVEATAATSPTAMPSPTAVPPTPTLAPTAALATATAIPPSPTAVAPTPVPQGQQVNLFYDSSGFYFHNPNSDRLRASSIRFEALNNSGNPAGPAFGGGLWAQFYSFIEQNRCDRIEVNQSPSYLRPAQCRGYNATVTLRADDDGVFWLQQSNVAQFRVFWNEAEVARCPATAGDATTCEVFLP